MKIIKIGAIWCTSCILVKNNLDKVLKQYPNITLEEYDIDFDEDIVKDYNPGTKLPVLIVLKDGKEINRQVGELNKKELINMIEGSK